MSEEELRQTVHQEITQAAHKQINAVYTGDINPIDTFINTQNIMQAIHSYTQEKCREARLDELDKLIDIEGKTFNRWSQKDIAHFFNTVGKRYRELQTQLNKSKGE